MLETEPRSLSMELELYYRATQSTQRTLLMPMHSSREGSKWKKKKFQKPDLVHKSPNSALLLPLVCPPRACSRSPKRSVGLFQHLPGSQRLTGDQRVRQEVARETLRPERKGLGEAKARTLTAEESGLRDQGLRGAPRGQGRVLGRDELRGRQA